jgi:hypothetical protein
MPKKKNTNQQNTEQSVAKTPDQPTTTNVGSGGVPVKHPQPQTPPTQRHSELFLHPEFSTSFFDVNSTDLQTEISICDLEISRCLKNIETGEQLSQNERKELKNAVNLLTTGIAFRDKMKSNEAVTRLRTLAEREADKLGWSELLQSWIELRRKLVDTQERASRNRSDSMPLDQVNTLMAAILTTIVKKGVDKKLLLECSPEFKEITKNLSAIHRFQQMSAAKQVHLKLQSGVMLPGESKVDYEQIREMKKSDQYYKQEHDRERKEEREKNQEKRN